MRNVIILAAVSTFAIAAPAAAQEEKPFDGFYVGGTIGYDVQPNDVGSTVFFDRNGDNAFNDAVTTAAGANAFSPGFCNGRAGGPERLPTGCQNDRDAISYSGRIGLDKQFGAIVVGVVGEFGTTDITDYVSAFSTTPANYVLARGIKWEGAFRARAGFAANNTLFYASGGGSYANIEHRFTSTNTQNAFAANGNEKEFGFVVGGGLEQKISRNISFGVEYSYHDYKDDEFRVRVTQGTAAATNPFVLAPNTAGTTLRRSDEDFRWHSARATLNFRF
jgi:outer membrane immunogenic protein